MRIVVSSHADDAMRRGGGCAVGNRLCESPGISPFVATFDLGQNVHSVMPAFDLIPDWRSKVRSTRYDQNVVIDTDKRARQPNRVGQTVS